MTLATMRDSNELEMVRQISDSFDLVDETLNKNFRISGTAETMGVWKWDGDNCPFYTTTDGCLQPGGCFWFPHDIKCLKKVYAGDDPY
jgi:hypothetical protein